MKTIFRFALVASIALTTTLVGCSTEEKGVDPNDEKTVSLTLLTGTRVPGTAIDGDDGDTSPVIFNEGAIYFTNGNSIVTMYEIVNDLEDGEGNPIGILGNQVDKAILGSTGVTFTNLSPQVKNVHVFGNSPVAYPSGGDITDMFADDYLNLASQTNNDGSIENVSLYGMSDLGTSTGVSAETGNELYSVDIDVYPVGARFEIGTIEATYVGTDYTTNITSFTLDGIFVDGYYETMGFDGTLGDVKVAPVTDPKAPHYIPTNFAEEMTDADSHAIDVRSYASQDDADAVWAYNLFAGKDDAAMPTFVIKVSDVLIGAEATPVLYPGTQFLAITGIRHAKAGTYRNGTAYAAGDLINNLERGMIYRIKNLKFAEGHLVEDPYVGAIDIEVEVEFIDWTIEEVDFDFN